MSSLFHMEQYNVVWNSPSSNSGESMPVGGHDIGCNIWVEKEDILLYMAQSGAFDEEGRMCKAGRLRIKISPFPFKEDFRQELILEKGFVRINGSNDGKKGELEIWVDRKNPCIHINIRTDEPTDINCIFESWRDKNSTAENPDKIIAQDGKIIFYHRNLKTPVFDKRIGEQGIERLRQFFPNVEKYRTFGGIIEGQGLKIVGNTEGIYGETPFHGYKLTGHGRSNCEIKIILHTNQTETEEKWEEELEEIRRCVFRSGDNARRDTQAWWKQYWERSYVRIKPELVEEREKDKDWQCGRNYNLFRYMLGCNAYGEYPTKFNGGLFTADPIYSDCSTHWSISPDDRDWGGLIFTAQNQRLVYWPMLKNGDFNLMIPQFEFYKRILEGVKKRTEYFFGLDDSACFPEQLDANGLSACYGKNGIDYVLQVRYHYVEALEFAYMILNFYCYSGNNIDSYLPFIYCVVNFYNKSYSQKDARGKRIIFPSTALESYHAADNPDIWGTKGPEAVNYNEKEVAVGNPADVIAALHDVLELLLKLNLGNKEQQDSWNAFLEELPPIPLEYKNGYLVVAPCEFPRNYVKINCEIPQLNTVFPYHVFGLFKPDLEIGVNTYKYAWDEDDQLSHVSWHTNGVCAARLGLLDEARKYLWLKLSNPNSRFNLGNTRRRFPAFWGPGHDYMPDHNWGGSGMLGLQEMLMQEDDDIIYLLPCWPKEVDVDFRLWAKERTCIDVSYRKGKLNYKIEPKNREKDIVICCS